MNEFLHAERAPELSVTNVPGRLDETVMQLEQEFDRYCLVGF
jgi:hypothetical protein